MTKEIESNLLRGGCGTGRAVAVRGLITGLMIAVTIAAGAALADDNPKANPSQIPGPQGNITPSGPDASPQITSSGVVKPPDVDPKMTKPVPDVDPKMAKPPAVPGPPGDPGAVPAKPPSPDTQPR